MAISRAQLLKELLPGLNALCGLEYARYGEETKEIFESESKSADLNAACEIDSKSKFKNKHTSSVRRRAL